MTPKFYRSLYLFLGFVFFAQQLCLFAQEELPPEDPAAEQLIEDFVKEQARNIPGESGIEVERQGELLTFDYRQADLLSVLRSLAYSYNLNLVPPKDLKGQVTLSLTGVTIDEALSAILEINGYTFTRKGNLIYITPGPGLEGLDTVTEILSLKYLAASEASVLLNKAISSQGDIRVNETTNSLVVTDFPSSIARVKKVLEDVDTAPIQVLIEAKLVDITEKDLENFGMTYSVDYKPVKGGLFERDRAVQEELATTQNMAGPSATLSGGQLKFTTITFKDITGSITLDALIQKNKAHVLASPSITTLNGKEARIIIGERFPYKEKTTTTTGTIESTRFADIGTTLRVTPRVSPEGWITMFVHPEVSTLTASLDAGPRISTREADATIRVRDGETIVIGGLIKREDSRNNGKVPILGDIPILGLFFRNSSADLSSTELVVFITPHIIQSPEDMDKISAKKESEAVVSIEGVGERITAGKLWEEARNLENNTGVESRSKDKEQRMSDALDHYRQIMRQYPFSDKADDALYRAGKISYDYFSDMELSRQFFSRLVETYKDSPFVEKSKDMLERIDKKSKK